MAQAEKGFAMLREVDGAIVLTRLDGSETRYSQWATLEEVLAEIPGTEQALEMGIPSASLTLFHLEDVCVAFNAGVVAGAAVPAPDPDDGWDSALAFVDSELPPIVLPGLRPQPTKLRAEERAYDYLNEAIVLSARNRLPAAGLFAPVTGVLDRIRLASWFRGEA